MGGEFSVTYTIVSPNCPKQKRAARTAGLLSFRSAMLEASSRGELKNGTRLLYCAGALETAKRRRAVDFWKNLLRFSH